MNGESVGAKLMTENIIGFLDLFDTSMICDDTSDQENRPIDRNAEEVGESDADSFNVSLLAWLEGYFPPAVFEQNIVTGLKEVYSWGHFLFWQLFRYFLK